MVVYIEIVLFENLLIDGLLLWLVLKALKLKTNWLGLCLASVFGALFALVSPKINISGFFAVLTKIFVCLLMCVILEFNFKKIIAKFILFLLFTFAFGGALISIFSFMGISTSVGFTFGYSTNIPVGAILAGIIIFAIILLRLFAKLYSRKRLAQFYFNISLTLNKKTHKLKGFLDTGNTLTNSAGKPVLLVDEKKIKNWFSPSEQLDILMSNFGNLRLENIEKKVVESVAGKQTLLVFDAVCRVGERVCDVAVGVCKNKSFFKRDFDVILNSKILEENNV